MITQQSHPSEQALIQHCHHLIPGGYVDVAGSSIKLKKDSNAVDVRYRSTKTSDHTHTQTHRISRAHLNHLLLQLERKDLIGKTHIKHYLVSHYRYNLSLNTIKGSFASIVQFAAYLKTSGKHHIEEITREDLCAFIEHLQDRGLKPRSVKTRLGALSAFLKTLIEKEVIGSDVLNNKLTIKLPESLPKAMDPDDVKLLLSVIHNVRDRAMVLVLLRTGMRIGELLHTKPIDIHIKESKIEIVEAQKSRVGRVVYLSDDAAEALSEWMDKRDMQKEYVFYSPRTNTPLSYTACRAMFERYLKKAQIAFKGYTLHSLRHTFASELLNAGMRLECLQQLLGHSNIEVTRQYARLTDTTRKDEYFKAMSIIEKGEIHGHYRLDSSLP
jgi:integrase/recombinase XerD